MAEKEYLEVLEDIARGDINPYWVRDYFGEDVSWRFWKIAKTTKLARILTSVICHLTNHRWNTEELASYVDELTRMIPDELREEWNACSESQSKFIKLLSDAKVLSIE